MKSFADRLTKFRDRHQYTNAGLAQFLSVKIGRDISVRSLESWVQGRQPHQIWRRALEEAIK